MLKILDYHLEGILITIGVLVFMVGLGYLITTDMNHSAQRAIACIEAGNQYISGDCVK
jgi:hypothetical protein